MHDFFFYLFSALTVLSALMVVLNRNAVDSAMCMILSFIGMAALFLLLDAFFLAILQVLVYAGAVMVLFLFIIMLLDVEKSANAIRTDLLAKAASVVAFGLLTLGLIYLFTSGDTATGPAPAVPEIPMADGGTNPMEYATASRSFGYGLFTKYMLPFQVAGFLLLIAMIGVIVLSKRLGPSGQEEPQGGRA